MPKIKLYTEIKAEIEIVFNLSRSIDLHTLSTAHTKEQAIAGKTTGLIELNEWVTWRAKHFGIYQKLTSKITQFDAPNYFVDEMVSGAFKNFMHKHYFMKIEEETLMLDVFEYTAPLGILGRVANVLFLKKYMINLLTQRNKVIKEFAESDQWKKILLSV